MGSLEKSSSWSIKRAKQEFDNC